MAAAVALALSAPIAATGQAGAAPSGQSDASHTSHTWADYFYPLKVGWTCHESLAAQGGVSGSETLTVSAVGTTRGGRTVTVDDSGEATAGGSSVPVNSALHYVLTNAGGLVSTPSSSQIAGQTSHIVGSTMFPTVRALLSGASSTSNLHITIPLTATQRSEIKGALPSNATGLNIAVAIRQSGSLVPALQTPAGTFNGALSVRSTLKSIHVTNAVKAASKELDSALRPAVAQELANTTWYALGQGPVKINLDGITAYVNSCGLNTGSAGG
ncbi:MAG TPA: hypothetical protein VHD39_03435 [Acidimicrobiales bacterium]|nr:hypothetical protein [Acidimicrobiales bacterium]